MSHTILRTAIQSAFNSINHELHDLEEIFSLIKINPHFVKATNDLIFTIEPSFLIKFIKEEIDGLLKVKQATYNGLA